MWSYTYFPSACISTWSRGATLTRAAVARRPSSLLMLGRASSMMPVRAAQRATARAATRVQHRYASGHGPSYNEPSGTYSDITDTRLPVRRKGASCRVLTLASSARHEAREGCVGEHLVLGYVWRCRCVRRHYVLQARPQVRTCPTHGSVRAWAAPEAEKRLDASGLPWRYKPSPNSGYPNGIP